MFVEIRHVRTKRGLVRIVAEKDDGAQGIVVQTSRNIYQIEDGGPCSLRK